MLTDPREIEIIQAAKQKNVRDPNRSRQHFVNIINDFFEGVELTGSYLDLGPGQFDFGEIVRERGGTCMAVDMDPAVVELGRFKGIETVEMNLKKLPKNPLGRKFNGVWNKFSFNAFWHWDKPDRHEALVQAVCDHIEEGGWSWISPWNGVPKKQDLSDADIARALDDQERFFRDRGFTVYPLTVDQAKSYGVNGTIANNVVFAKNLNWTKGEAKPDSAKKNSSVQVMTPGAAPTSQLSPDEKRGTNEGAYFPQRLLTDFFEFIKANDDKFTMMTYGDVQINHPEDHTEEHNYINEFREWIATVGKSEDGRKKAHILLQYDIDSRPDRANSLLAHLSHDDIPVNVMMFKDRIDRKHLKKTKEVRFTEYDFDMELMQRRMKEGFQLGYHVNAYEKSGWDMDRAMEIFNDDMTYFHETYGSTIFSAHGGVPGPNGLNNNSLHYHEDWTDKAIWVHNGRTLRFHSYFSDGGHNSKARDPAGRDLRDFVATMQPGKRYRLLLHPQYYAVNNGVSKRFSGTKWYDDMIAMGNTDPNRSTFADIKLEFEPVED